MHLLTEDLRRGKGNARFSCELKCREHFHCLHQGLAIWNDDMRFYTSFGLKRILPVNFIVNQNSYCIIKTCIRVYVDQVLYIIQNICNASELLSQIS